MLFISLLPDLSLPLQAFLDALILSAFVVPALYFLFFQPIQKTLIDKARTEAQRAELEKMDKIKGQYQYFH